MTSRIFSCTNNGLDFQLIEVQADVSAGLPAFNIVGLGDATVQESKERVRISIKNSGAEFPLNRKTVNLAPAHVRKQGALFDLPIAASILLATHQIKPEFLENSLLIGELSLNGKIKSIPGALPITQFAKENKIQKIFLPKENAQEASFIDHIAIYPLENLSEFIAICNGQKQIASYPHQNIHHYLRLHRPNYYQGFSQIIGQEKAKRALQIAAAGHHNVLFFGSPGCGKTVLARAFQGLLGNMKKEEILSVTKIYSIAGLLNQNQPITSQRPFREIHHTASITSITGGGTMHARPGEISLAHHGVLFFDEIAEFRTEVLESLRQPLEDKYININRANFSTKFPCNFIFIATMNPCPCGYFLDQQIRCKCTETQIRKYQKKLSGPLLDRFDIFLQIQKSPLGKLLSSKTQNDFDEAKTKIQNAHKIQRCRFKNERKNSGMSLKFIRSYCQLNQETEVFFQQAALKLHLSNRAHLKILKLARTIADLEESPNIQLAHLAEALQYRQFI